jgi:N6-L-threonylcarbamoyladenine synthase
MDLSRIDGIAVSAGPGLIGGVLVGLTAAKALALVTGKPLIAVNHLEAHALTPRLTDGVAFPYLLLLVSGGHTQLVAVEGVGQYRRIGTTIDDALGEAFDKVAKMLGLPYPGGPEVEAAADRGNPERFDFPRPLCGRPEPDFSLSGLKTAVRQQAEAIAPLQPGDIPDLCASFQAAVVDMLVDRVAHGCAQVPRQPWPAQCAGGGRRRRRQPGDPPGAPATGARIRRQTGRPAAQSLHRQRRDGRLGRHRAAWPRPHRFP